ARGRRRTAVRDQRGRRGGTGSAAGRRPLAFGDGAGAEPASAGEAAAPARLSRLSNLRAPLERAGDPFLTVLRPLRFERLPSPPGQPCQLGAPRGRPADHSAQEPARAIDAEEPHRLQLLAALALPAGVDPRTQLDAERPRGLLDLAAGLGDLLGYLLPVLIPQPAGLGRRESLELEPAVAAHHGNPDALLLGHVDLDIEAVAGGDQQAAEIHPVAIGIGAGAVPGPRLLLPAKACRGRPCRRPLCPRPGLGIAQIYVSSASGGTASVRVVLLGLLGGQVILVSGLACSGLTCSRLLNALAAAPSEHPARSLLAAGICFAASRPGCG